MAAADIPLLRNLSQFCFETFHNFDLSFCWNLKNSDAWTEQTWYLSQKNLSCGEILRMRNVKKICSVEKICVQFKVFCRILPCVVAKSVYCNLRCFSRENLSQKFCLLRKMANIRYGTEKPEFDKSLRRGEWLNKREQSSKKTFNTICCKKALLHLFIA